MKIAVISDLHGNLIYYPSDYWKHLWECEALFICGDIFPLHIQFDIPKCRSWLMKEFIPWATELPVEKVYIIGGNHDSDKIVGKLWEADLIEEYYKLTTITVEGDPELPSQALTLCHFPMVDWYDKERGAWMVHGHQHQLPGTPSCSVMHWDVGVDKNNMTPISFEQLKINITTQFIKRNEDCSN